VIFGFGKKKKDEAESAPEDELEYVLFRGALNGKDANLSENARLAQAGLIPAKEIVTDALLRRAEAFRIDPKGKVAAVTLYIDGVPYPGGRMAAQQGLAVAQMLKLLAGLDIRERSKRQAGGVRAELDNVKYELKVESTPIESGGERIWVYAVDVKKRLESPDEIGIPEKLKQTIRELTSQKNGLILACGPPKSGTTTTAIGIVKSVDAYLYTIYSLVDLDGRELAHVTNFETEQGDDLETTISRCLRVEADVIFTDPLRDAETARTVFSFHSKVALISEIVAKDPASAVVQMMKWLDDPKETAEGLKLVIGQKLVRLLCGQCRLAFRPNPKLLSKAGLPPESRVLYRPATVEGVEDAEPCAKCGGIGYLGRTAIFEVIAMTEGMQALVAGGASAYAIRGQSRKEHMLSFRREGIRLVAEGKTSLEELQRVLKPA
jgi:type IV pilus assembly protein PilB